MPIGLGIQQLSLLWFRSLLWNRFNRWPRNFPILCMKAKKKKKKKKKKERKRSQGKEVREAEE